MQATTPRGAPQPAGPCHPADDDTLAAFGVRHEDVGHSERRRGERV